MNHLLTAFLFLTVFSTTVFANLPDPSVGRSKPPKTVDTSLTIRLDNEATQARLIIPKSQIKQLRAELEGLDNQDAPAATTFAFSKLQTIVTGSLLSLALVFGGVWFARKSNNGGKVLGIGAVLLAGGAFATFVFANAGPPSEARSITGKLFTQSVHIYKFAYGKVKLETTDEGNNIVLVVPDHPDKPGEE